MKPSRDISRLIEIMAALRNPDGGCPWDLEQDFASIRNYTIEEAYEVADAIEREDFDDLREELGDLLLQPVYHAQMASERGLFDIGDVVYAITEKLIRRHPHVFGEEAARNAGGAKAQVGRGQGRRTRQEGRAQAGGPLDPRRRAARPARPRPRREAQPPRRLGRFRLARLAADARQGRRGTGRSCAKPPQADDKAKIHEELGDLLFATANLARKLGVEPEAALRDANLKFDRRFRYVEERSREDGVPLAEAGLERMDGYWNEIRAKDRSGGV